MWGQVTKGCSKFETLEVKFLQYYYQRRFRGGRMSKSDQHWPSNVHLKNKSGQISACGQRLP